VQFPLNSQSLNPYSYILNNPLSGTDPTGYAFRDILSGQTEIGRFRDPPTRNDEEEKPDDSNNSGGQGGSGGPQGNGSQQENGGQSPTGASAEGRARQALGLDAKGGSSAQDLETIKVTGHASPADGSSGLTRFFGALKVVGGIAECSAGGALCSTGVGCAATVLICAHAADTISSGAKEYWYGVPQQSLTSKGLQAAGLSREQADFTDAALGLASVGAAGAKSATLIQGLRGAAQGASVAEHVVLGIRNDQIYRFAQENGATHFLDTQHWLKYVTRAASDRNVRFTVFLDGFQGANTYSQVMNAVKAGAGEGAAATQIEMAILSRAGRLPEVTFMRDGAVVKNPFAAGD
jgi:hypothetical protein